MILDLIINTMRELITQLETVEINGVNAIQILLTIILIRFIIKVFAPKTEGNK